jgi:hypothetical protein
LTMNLWSTARLTPLQTPSSWEFITAQRTTGLALAKGGTMVRMPMHKPDFHPWRLIAAAFEAVGSPLLNPSANVWRISPRDLLLSMNLAPVSALSVPY